MKAKIPASATPIVSNVVATGRPMNGADGFTLPRSSTWPHAFVAYVYASVLPLAWSFLLDGRTVYVA